MSDYFSWLKDQRNSLLNAKKKLASKEKIITSWVPSWLPEKSKAVDDNIFTCQDILSDIIMTRLRTSEGLDLDWIRTKYLNGEKRAQAVLDGAELALSLGLAERVQVHGAGDHLRLVDPDGFLFSNSIISSIFVELEEVDEGDAAELV
eukprot:CAMPEP_0183324884 /NCGR_PEP_ID=MMETSP0160_2-20130417/78253_1 /TAXON_ID=2839 ORGANISM="Odontella Sinensis, Strain Grunow 1884" /NCGR_SAMPLE_ID=MMETSP0160_2 /ASSEMBLY_ACC=CAM_ASM_000250 /LENGTH=147 /DNA_ID=CAMNT_0025492567 /DNA_START=72 /DNA_END=515 /DNA_ORIENTATION=+